MQDYIISALNEKSSIQLNIMELKIARFSKLESNKINNIKDNLKKTLMSQAIKYKRNISKNSKTIIEIDNIINSYIMQLNYISNIYNFAIAKQLSRISDIQFKIHFIDVNRIENKNKYSEIDNEYDNKLNQLKLKEKYLKLEKTLCKKIIEECEKNIEYFIIEKEKTFDNLNNFQKYDLENIKSNKAFKKMFESILNRIGGNKKFVEESINPIKNQLKFIIEKKIPEIKNIVDNQSIDLCEKIDCELKEVPDKTLQLLNEDVFSKNRNLIENKFNFNVKNCEVISRIYLVDKIKKFAEIGIITSKIFGKDENKILKNGLFNCVIMETKNTFGSMMKKINMNTEINKNIIEEINEILGKAGVEEYVMCAV